MERQASALLQFREKARILVFTSIGEEDRDIPTADIEVWIDPLDEWCCHTAALQICMYFRKSSPWSIVTFISCFQLAFFDRE